MNHYAVLLDQLPHLRFCEGMHGTPVVDVALDPTTIAVVGAMRFKFQILGTANGLFSPLACDDQRVLPVWN